MMIDLIEDGKIQLKQKKHVELKNKQGLVFFFTCLCLVLWLKSQDAEDEDGDEDGDEEQVHNGWLS